NTTGSPKIVLEPAFPSLSFTEPVALYQSSSKQWFLIEQSGVIQTFNQTGDNAQHFLDIQDRVLSGGERGLLGMALTPDFETTGYFYVSYTDKDGNSVVSLFSSQPLSSQNYVADRDSERIVLTIPQPYSNHNGGQISFGPDGYLYIGLGDGGSGGDPKRNGQNVNTLLGAMLRIDVSNHDGSYSIPPTNPFATPHSNINAKAEIYAYGLRNPWRWSFDKITGDLWLADVGQNKWEEINIIKNGGNYGWNITEGNHCFGSNNKSDKCNDENLTKPVYEYSHEEGYAITGGYVYRGKQISKLQGYYVYGDFATRKIWAFKQNRQNSNVTTENWLIAKSPTTISSFAEDNAGNLYVIGYQDGKIYRISQ
ncbi:MAG: PQQ-dependent sugar dehydrogenase, partial [Gammaproteobacteria bacterium]|nr:PQQ-dependent sugar dehydrogenase [Gammaproteobacteria bacterium]